MTIYEIKNTPWIVDYLLDKCVTVDSRMKLHKRLDKICNLAIEALEQEPKWISVIEGLPKENGEYLTTTIYNEVYCDYWEEDHFNRTEAVIAWMPKPEPYNVESEV